MADKLITSVEAWTEYSKLERSVKDAITALVANGTDIPVPDNANTPYLPFPDVETMGLTLLTSLSHIRDGEMYLQSEHGQIMRLDSDTLSLSDLIGILEAFN